MTTATFPCHQSINVCPSESTGQSSYVHVISHQHTTHTTNSPCMTTTRCCMFIQPIHHTHDNCDMSTSSIHQRMSIGTINRTRTKLSIDCRIPHALPFHHACQSTTHATQPTQSPVQHIDRLFTTTSTCASLALLIE